jgi:hypothetical protein
MATQISHQTGKIPIQTFHAPRDQFFFVALGHAPQEEHATFVGECDTYFCERIRSNVVVRPRPIDVDHEYRRGSIVSYVAYVTPGRGPLGRG